MKPLGEMLAYAAAGFIVVVGIIAAVVLIVKLTAT